MWEEKQRTQPLTVIWMVPGGLAICHKGRGCSQRASEVFADVDFFCGSRTVGRFFSGYFNGFSFTLNGYKNMLNNYITIQTLWEFVNLSFLSPEGDTASDWIPKATASLYGLSMFNDAAPICKAGQPTSYSAFLLCHSCGRKTELLKKKKKPHYQELKGAVPYVYRV